MKDLFIDTNIASRFANPMDPEYKKLLAWIFTYDPANPAENACLVVSKKLLGEYYASARHAPQATAIPAIIDMLVRQGRQILVTNDQIKEFKHHHFSKAIIKKLRSNQQDREHIPVVMLSHRKFALAIDSNFIYDLTHFPGFIVRAEKRPEDLPYQ